jgi:TPR repeat protein
MSHKNTIEQSPASNALVSPSSRPFQTTDLIDTTPAKPEGKGLGDVLNSSPLSPADQKALSGASQESLNGKTPDEQYFEQQLLLARTDNATAQFYVGWCYENGCGVAQDYAQAVEWYEKAAKQGDAAAQCNLGVCYEHGRGVAQDYAQAVEWCEKAAKQGDAAAQRNLGLCYEHGRGVAQDYVQTVEWCEKAAKQGFAAAQRDLGLCYEHGRGVAQDYAQAVEWYTKAAVQGNMYAQNNLGMCYELGCGVTKNQAQAVEWYTKAAVQGHANAQNNLGMCYAMGRGVTQDYTQAVEWYEKAAKQGQMNAQSHLGGSYYEGGRGVAQDYAQAVEWYTKAAVQGNMYAQNNLGVCYELGRGVAQDYAQAVEWYTKAAVQGNMYAQDNLGVCYELGRGVAQDYAQAVEWYTKAAVQGHTGTQAALDRINQRRSDEQYFEQGLLRVQKCEADIQECEAYIQVKVGLGVEWAVRRLALEQQRLALEQQKLALCYWRGRGVTQDYVKAVEWYTKAAAQGSASAQLKLGECYEDGRGVTQDYVKAVEWYAKAVAQGHAQAQFNLGVCYEFGRGVTQDHVKAVEWYAKAVAQGHAQAQARLDEINRRKSAQALSASPKAEVKQEIISNESTPKQEQNGDSLFKLDVFGSSSSSPSSVISSVSLTTPDRETKESKPTNLLTEVSQLTTDIQQGGTAALSKALTTPVAQQSEPLQNYLQSQAIWTVLESEAKPAQKAEQIALLIEAPGVSLLVENEQGQRPLDVALQQFAAGHINKVAVEKLQEATYRQLAEEEGEVFNAIEEYAKSVSTDVSDEKTSSRPVEAKSMADPKDGPITPQQLAAEVQKLRKVDESLQQQFKTVSLPAPQPSASSSSQPKQLSKQQRNMQKKLFQQMVQQLVSKRFIKSVGIGQGWVVEDVSMKKAATKAGITFVAGTVANVFLPGIGGAAVSGVKTAAEAAEHRRQIKKSRKHTLGLTSLNQLAMVTNYIEQGLLHRYQDFLLQQNLLLPQKAMETLINCLIERMCLYVEKIDKAKEIIPLLGEKFVNLNKQKKAGQAVIPDTKFTDAVAAQVAENLVAGTSLLSLSRIGSLVDKVGSGSDALITCLTADGSEKELHVNDICHSPAVTLTADAEKASLEVNTVASDLEYEGRHLPGSEWIVGECGVICISREEAVVEELEEVTADWGSDGLPIMKAHSDVAKWRAKAEAAGARADAEKVRADTAEARVSDLEQQLDDAELSQRSLGQQLLAMSGMVETAEAKVLKPQRRGAIAPGDPKSPTNHRSKGGPGMFDSKLNAAGNPIKPLPPVSSFQLASPKPKSGLPSTPTTPASPVR